MEEFLQRLPEILQNTYFSLNPLNPNNTEDNYQELLRENISKIIGVRVESEITSQKTAQNIFNETVSLKNKSERYDLTIDSLETLLELKNLVEIDDNCVHQLLHYLDTTDYKYGILINFAKSNKKKDYCVTCRIYLKGELKVWSDRYGYTYNRHQYTLIDTTSSDNYLDLVGSYIDTDTYHKNI
jgi:GxxExxY protein